MKFFKPKFWDKNGISPFSILLFPIALLHRLIYVFQNLLIKPHRFAIPIICVGNIYLGGTGKTPFCIKLFSILKKIKKNPIFVKKKYTSFRDEVLMLGQLGPVYENKKRKIAIENAIKNNSDIAILDDGFQDNSIFKNLSIICFTEKQWIGNGLTLPSGPLREGLSSLSRANIVIINGSKNNNIERKIFGKNNKIKIFYTSYKAENIDEFANMRTVAFAGIGNPENFFILLKKNKVSLIEEIYYPDHYNYSEKDLKKLEDVAKEKDAILLTTEKDYLRINEAHKKNIRFLKVETEIKNENEFIEEVKKFI